MQKFKQQPQYLQQRLLQAAPSKAYIHQKQTDSEQLKQRLIMQRRNALRNIKLNVLLYYVNNLNLVSPLATIARGYRVT